MALKGQPTEHIKMIATTINMSDPEAAQAWVSGHIKEYAEAKAAKEALDEDTTE